MHWNLKTRGCLYPHKLLILTDGHILGAQASSQAIGLRVSCRTHGITLITETSIQFWLLEISVMSSKERGLESDKCPFHFLLTLRL